LAIVAARCSILDRRRSFDSQRSSHHLYCPFAH
jgi:hypothetical protein